jgi:hypothetical protein
MTARYNVAYTLAFSADQVDRENPTKAELLAGLRRRLAEVEGYPEDELIGAVWPPFDSFDRDEQRVDAPLLQVLVPKPGSAASHFIARGSGIVAIAGTSPTVTVDYEGNIYNAENLRDYTQRVQHAADRLLTRYPTTARGPFPRHTFDVVGTYRGGVLVIIDPARVRDWCDQ